MKLVFLCIVFGLTTVPRASTGGLSGKVVDSDTHQPLVGANVMVVGTDIGTSCDAEGVFSISNIPVGGYRVDDWILPGLPCQCKYLLSTPNTVKV